MSDRASETVTVRVTPGTVAKVKAITGQPFSTTVRQILDAFIALNKEELEKGSLKNRQAAELRTIVAEHQKKEPTE